MNNKKIIALIVIPCLLVSLIIGGILIVNNLNKSTYPRTITDSLGREVGIPLAENITKIVGINPGALRLIVYMQAEDLVCGVEDIDRNPLVETRPRPYTFAHPELTDLPSIGPQFGGDPELIAAQDPDVIFSTTNFFTGVNADELQSLTGIPVVAINDGLNGDVNDLLNALDVIGEVLGKANRSNSLKNLINDMLFDLNNRTKDIDDADKDWIYIGGIGYHGAHGISSTECQYDPLAYINGKNSAENVTIGHATIDIETILEWENISKLNYILVDGGGYDLCMYDFKNTEASNLDCIKENRTIMVFPYNYYSHNYATIFANAYFLGNRFFHGYFSDLNYTDGQLYDQIYNDFLGAEVWE
jgi:iron complex transport system substrate-binding protein